MPTESTLDIGASLPQSTNVAAERLKYGLVVIGRNEGERLKTCLRSVRSPSSLVVYVDSGSTDGSVEAARDLGVRVIELDMSIPFTAARARNAGFTELCQDAPDLQFVQFVDGDCEVFPGWLDTAAGELNRRPDIAAVCGHIHERYPDRSVYNALCQLEWDTPVGVVAWCGGNAMMRVDAFKSVGGFNAALIAGEEPDLCQRLRAAGRKIAKISVDMVRHDVDMVSFSQWRKRSIRWGYAAAQLAHLHGKEVGVQLWWPTANSAFWALGLPAAILLAMRVTPLASIAFGLYPARMIRLYWRWRALGRSQKVSLAYALLNTSDKFSELIGSSRFGWDLASGHRSRIIEHKRQIPS